MKIIFDKLFLSCMKKRLCSQCKKYIAFLKFFLKFSSSKIHFIDDSICDIISLEMLFQYKIIRHQSKKKRKKNVKNDA